MRRQPWPERTGEVQCLGECLGKAGRLRFEPDIAPLRAKVAGVNGAGTAIKQPIDFFEALRNYHSTVDSALLQGSPAHLSRRLDCLQRSPRISLSLTMDRRTGSIDDGGSRKGSKGNAVRVRERTMPRLPPQL